MIGISFATGNKTPKKPLTVPYSHSHYSVHQFYQNVNCEQNPDLPNGCIQRPAKGSKGTCRSPTEWDLLICIPSHLYMR